MADLNDMKGDIEIGPFRFSLNKEPKTGDADRIAAIEQELVNLKSLFKNHLETDHKPVES